MMFSNLQLTVPLRTPPGQVFVMSTGVPLSQRFKKIANQKLKKAEEEEESFSIRMAPLGAFNPASLMDPVHDDSKDKEAEILRLRAQLRAAMHRMNSGNKGGLNKIRRSPMKKGRNLSIKKRLSFNSKGRSGQSSPDLFCLGLSQEEEEIGFPSRKGSYGGKRNNKGGKFFGKPKDKDDLDKELDDYMAKAKSKQKIDLDKELDEYLASAKNAKAADEKVADKKTWREKKSTDPYSVDSDDELKIADADGDMLIDD